jgi:hypothetical protein
MMCVVTGLDPGSHPRLIRSCSDFVRILVLVLVRVLVLALSLDSLSR